MFKGVPVRYRMVLQCASWILSLGSVAVSFVTLPTFLAGTVSVIALIVPWIVSRTIFVHRVLWVMPPLSAASERDRLGTMWSVQEVKGKRVLALGFLYEEFKYAKEAYNVFRSWNLGRYIDEDGNIAVSIIDEGNHRYSIFTRPGNRSKAEEALRTSVLAKQPRNTAAVVKRLLYYTITCADYSDRPEVEEAIQTLKRLNTLLFNTHFCKGDEITPFAKRYFQLQKFRFLKRSSLTPRDFESNFSWTDGRAIEPEKTKRTDELSRRLNG
jgi:hypothetical protein